MITRRIVSVQHGDYRESLQIIGSGQVEPYSGMAYSLEVLANLFGDAPHLVISLDAPSYREQRGAGELVGLPTPRLPRRIPRRVAEYLQARQILRLIHRFRPTHLLLRTARPILCRSLLRYAKKRNLNTLVVFANVMTGDDPRSMRRNRELTDLLNQPFVFRVGNHRWPATQSLVDYGLAREKALAYDWPSARRAADYPIKQLPPPPYQLLYIGTLSQPKGVGDLLDAALLLYQKGIDLRLTIVGSGNDEPLLRQKAQALPAGIVHFAGRLPNDEVFRLMLGAALLFVPSRYEFPEGMPFTLTEGLTSRTPVIASDHPVLVPAFEDGTGLRFFRASDPTSMAEVTQSVLNDTEAYRHLSETTAAALDRVNCPFSFGNLIEQWQASYPTAISH